jgi:hypothetical protein
LARAGLASTMAAQAKIESRAIDPQATSGDPPAVPTAAFQHSDRDPRRSRWTFSCQLKR